MPLALAYMSSALPGTVRLRRAVLRLAFLVAIFVLYIFSSGPVARLCGATANTGFDDLPLVVRFIYAPYVELMKPGILPNALWQPLNRYDAWWIPGTS